MAICRSCRNTKSQGFEGNTEGQRKKPIAFRNMHYMEIIHAECARYRCNPVDARVQENAAGPIKGEYRDRKLALQLNFPIQLLRYFYPSPLLFSALPLTFSLYLYFFLVVPVLSVAWVIMPIRGLKLWVTRRFTRRKLVFRDDGGCSLVICKVRVRWERK